MSTDRRAFLQTSLAVPAMGAAIAAAEAAPAPSKAKFRRIAVEETFATHEYLEARLKMVSGPNAVLPPNGQSPSDGKLMDLGAGRLADMDAAGVDFQVCSIFTSTGMLPKDISTGIMQRSNDILAKGVQANPKRLGGLIGVFPQNINDAVKEIERGAKELKLNGAIINSTTLNEYLDDPKYLPVWEALAEHDLSLYLHPSRPPRQMIEALDIPGYNTAWSFGVDAGTHAVRIMAAGIFDRFPKMRLVLGHMGESLPFWIYRMDIHYRREFPTANPSKLKKEPGEYMRENIYVTSSGMNFWPQVRMAQDVLGPDHVMFALDYPFENLKDGVKAMDEAPMPDDVKHKFYHGIAEKIFKIPA